MTHREHPATTATARAEKQPGGAPHGTTLRILGKKGPLRGQGRITFHVILIDWVKRCMPPVVLLLVRFSAGKLIPRIKKRIGES